MHLIPVKVDCHAGYKADESPCAFWWQDRRIEVEEVVDRWYQGGVDPGQPQADYFRVRCGDQHVYVLKHDHEGGEWFLAKSFRPWA